MKSKEIYWLINRSTRACYGPYDIEDVQRDRQADPNPDAWLFAKTVTIVSQCTCGHSLQSHGTTTNPKSCRFCACEAYKAKYEVT